jgi:uncharacterized protein
LGSGKAALMLVLLDSNIFLSALISPHGAPHTIYARWVEKDFRVVTCREQLDEIRSASRYPHLRAKLQPHLVGTMLNHLYGAEVFPEPIPRRHTAADPGDSYLLDLIDAAQPDFAVTGDKRSGLLQRRKLGRTRIMDAASFCSKILKY